MRFRSSTFRKIPPAEYGWKPGAIVNVGLKSGTNTLHGTAFAFGRDGAMDARNYFNAAPAAKTPRTLEQFGGSLGGAIVKDKAFFFGAYEGQRYNVGNSYSVTTPSMVSLPDAGNCISVTGDCGNSIPDAIADLVANDVPISAASQQISGCTVSGSTVTCNGTGFPINNTQSPNVVQGFPNDVGVDNALGKVDFNLNQRNSISGMYFYRKQQRHGRRFSGTAIQVAVEDSHPRAGRGRKLDLDPEALAG